MRLCIVLTGLLAASVSHAAEHSEAEYIRAYAKSIANAQTEVEFENGTRVDIMTLTHVYEVEFAPKWAESLGQVLNYSLQTGYKPAVILILREPGDVRFLRRILPVANLVDVPVYPYYKTEIIPEDK